MSNKSKNKFGPEFLTLGTKVLIFSGRNISSFVLKVLQNSSSQLRLTRRCLKYTKSFYRNTTVNTSNGVTILVLLVDLSLLFKRLISIIRNFLTIKFYEEG